jgi:hypothetical protein
MKSIEYWEHRDRHIPTHIRDAYTTIKEWEEEYENGRV